MNYPTIPNDNDWPRVCDLDLRLLADHDDARVRLKAEFELAWRQHRGESAQPLSFHAMNQLLCGDNHQPESLAPGVATNPGEVRPVSADATHKPFP